ncbi:RNA polymerase sigma-70 factor [Carboxylicivirga sediminis]|uniref:RNA polymerase sigma-70 factor n=1 Tax=Carboxylicivirga sediminis TaxID=2006564 RepID=A0A941F817_9BACT|nr:RNA polymerase sigma-70 factor [Carboxylicivirga sediminis]MBR8538312.1 RNA polymerase sigma-70 factor [Carboxylicivirga sediminis]
MPDTPDTELVKVFAIDETKAFEGLYLKYGRKLLEFARHYMPSKDDAEEVVQKVFIKLWQKRHELKHNESVKGYIFTIAYNEIRKAFIKQKRENELLQSYYFEHDINRSEDSDEIDYAALARKVDTIVEQMPEKRKKVYLLCKKEGLTVSEVAEHLQLSEKTVKNQLTAAYRQIREQLQGGLAILLFLTLYDICL